MTPKKKRKIPASVIDALAKDLGKSLRTVRDYIRCGLPVTPKGYDPSRVAAWLTTRRLGGPKESGDDGDRWVTEYRRYKAQRQKLEYLREMGKTIYRSEAKQWLFDLSSLINKEIRDLPDQLSGAVYRALGDRIAAVEANLVAERTVRSIVMRLRAGIADLAGIGNPDEVKNQDADRTQPDGAAIGSKSANGQRSDFGPSETGRPSESGDSEVIAHANRGSQSEGNAGVEPGGVKEGVLPGGGSGHDSQSSR